MIGVAGLLVLLGFVLFVVPEATPIAFCCFFAAFGCVALDNHNHDEGR